MVGFVCLYPVTESSARAARIKPATPGSSDLSNDGAARGGERPRDQERALELAVAARARALSSGPLSHFSPDGFPFECAGAKKIYRGDPGTAPPAGLFFQGLPS